MLLARNATGGAELERHQTERGSDARIRADCLSPSINWPGRKDISNDLRATRARRLPKKKEARRA